MDDWMDGCMAWVNGRIDGQMDGWRYEGMSVLVVENYEHGTIVYCSA